MIPVLVLLIYGIAVGGVVALFWRFLPAWSRRRAVLEVVTHTVFQRSSIRGNPATTRTGFDAIVTSVLHGTNTALATYLAAFDREHNIRADAYIRQAMERHAAVAKEGRPAC